MTSSTLHAHYLVMVGVICDHARTGQLPVQIVTSDGRSVSGVPTPHHVTDGEAAELDHTGFANDLVVGGETISLADVVEVRVSAPAS